MSKSKKHNLSFSQEELTGKKEQKLSADVSKAKHNTKPKKQMKIKQNLKFDEDKVKPSERLNGNMKDVVKSTPRRITSAQIHNKIEKESDDNSSVEAANKGAELTENTVRNVRTYERRKNRNVSDESTKSLSEEKQRLKEEKNRLKDEKKIDNEIIDNLYDKYKESHPESGSNPYSKWKQKQEIRKQYYAAKKGETYASATVTEEIKSKAKNTAENAGKRIVEFAKENKTGLIVVGGVVIALILVISMFGSVGGTLVSSGTGAVSATTYPSEDAEMISANNYYCSLETQLQSTISSFESTHSYDEYRYSLDQISHDPYELTSFLTAKQEGAYLANNVQSLEQSVFALQYVLTTKVVKETRYRTETRYGQYTVTDEYGNSQIVIYSYQVQVPYDYYICYVTLNNNGIDSAANALLSSDQNDMYDIYNITKGNRDDLF